MSRGRIIAAVVALVVVIGVVGAVVFGGQSGAPKVETAEVTKATLGVTVTASGKVVSGIRADIFPASAGLLSEVVVEDGQAVKAGDLIASMDDGPLQIAVAQAEAGVAAAKAQLDGLDNQEPSSADITAAKAGATAAEAAYKAANKVALSVKAPTATQIAAADAGMDAAKAGYDVAKAGYDALKAAHDATTTPSPSLEASLTAAQIAKDTAYSGYLSAKSAYDSLVDFDLTSAKMQATAGARQAYAAWMSARAQVAKLDAYDGTAARAAANAGVDQAETALAVAQTNLEKGGLTAPIDGVVVFNAIGAPGTDGTTPKPQDGCAVGPQAAPFTVVDPTGLKFVADVDEADVDRVDVGMKTTVSLDAFPEVEFEGTVLKIKTAATQTPTGGTVFEVEVALTTGENDVLIGMKGDATIEVKAVEGSVTIPVEALYEENDTSFVYVVEANKLKKVEIRTGTVTETDVQVLSGVEPGDVVAKSGPVEYKDGMAVRTE